MAISTTFVLTDIRIAQGYLHKALAVYEHGLQLAKTKNDTLLQGTADMYLGLSGLYHQQGKYELSKANLQQSETLGAQIALPDWAYRLCLAQARFKQSQAKFNEALDFLDEAEHLQYSNPVPEVQPISAMRARLWIKQGRLLDAWHWARTQNLSIQDELNYLREFEHITLARLLLAEYKQNTENQRLFEAIKLLERLHQAAEAGERRGSVIEILILQALAYQAQDNIPRASEILEQAIELAEPEHFVQIFVDEGGPIVKLLTIVYETGIHPDYVNILLATLEVDSSSDTIQTLIDPLSERELEVLHLIADGLSNNEISEKLFLALSTVKGHNRHTFDKLQVQRRTEAVARARELGLL